jgi:hypothetical protein
MGGTKTPVLFGVIVVNKDWLSASMGYMLCKLYNLTGETESTCLFIVLA